MGALEVNAVVLRAEVFVFAIEVGFAATENSRLKALIGFDVARDGDAQLFGDAVVLHFAAVDDGLGRAAVVVEIADRRLADVIGRTGGVDFATAGDRDVLARC